MRRRGAPRFDPVVFFKLRLILCFEGPRSERQLMRVVADRLSLRWYLGYDLTDSLPDHSSLTRIRERHGVAVFRRCSEAAVGRSIAAGLAGGREPCIDSTDAAANASIDPLQPRFAVEAHLARLFNRDVAGEDGGDDDGGNQRGENGEQDGPIRLPVAPTGEARAELAGCAADRDGWIGETGRPDRTRTSGPDRRTAGYRASPADPDASPLRPNGTGARLGYRDHYVVDGGKARIILTALVTPAEVQDNQPAPDHLRRTRLRWKSHPRQVTGDRRHGTVENIAAIEDRRVRAYPPLSAAGRKPGLFRDTDFVDNPEADTHRSPGQGTLRFISRRGRTQRRVHEAPATACAVCALRTRCASPPRGRRIGRSLDAMYLERVRGRHGTDAYAKAMR